MYRLLSRISHRSRIGLVSRETFSSFTWCRYGVIRQDGGPLSLFPDRFHRHAMIYTDTPTILESRFILREIPPATLPRRINEYCMATFPCMPYLALSSWPFLQLLVPTLHLGWHPTDRAAGVGVLWSRGGTRRTGRRNREEDGESEKVTEREKGRWKREGKRRKDPGPTDT